MTWMTLQTLSDLIFFSYSSVFTGYEEACHDDPLRHRAVICGVTAYSYSGNVTHTHT